MKTFLKILSVNKMFSFKTHHIFHYLRNLNLIIGGYESKDVTSRQVEDVFNLLNLVSRFVLLLNLFDNFTLFLKFVFHQFIYYEVCWLLIVIVDEVKIFSRLLLKVKVLFLF